MPQHIVVIDDAPSIVDLYDELLSDEGYTVVATFSEPPSDPQVIEQHQPDLIILDWLSYDKSAEYRTRCTIFRMAAWESPSLSATACVLCTVTDRR